MTTIFDTTPERIETGDRTIQFRWLANADSRNHNGEPAEAHLELRVFHHAQRYTAQLNTVHIADRAEFRAPFDAITVAVEAAPRYSATMMGVFADKALEVLRRTTDRPAIDAMSTKARA